MTANRAFKGDNEPNKICGRQRALRAVVHGTPDGPPHALLIALVALLTSEQKSEGCRGAPPGKLSRRYS